MKYLKLSRRKFLGAGLSTAAATALAPMLPLSERYAEAVGVPKRLFLVFYNGGSVVSQDWPVGGETDFTFPSMVDFFTPFKSKMIMLRNMRRGMDGSHGSHQGGTGGVWSARKTLAASGPGPWMTGPSIDQIIIDRIKQPTPFPTLPLDVQLEEGFNLRSRTRFDQKGFFVPGEQDPAAAFDRIFTDGIATTTSDPKVAERLRNERRSVLDLIHSDLDSLQATMGGQDKIRLEQHLESVRSIESRLTPGSAGATDTVFKPPVRDDYPKMDFLANANYPKVGKMHMDLLVAALASDRTRLPSLQWSQGNGCKMFTWVGVTGQHHALTHGGVTTPQLDKINQYHMSQHAYLMGQLDSIKEANGTLLDNTVVVFANELHDGYSHSPDPSQVYMAGSGNGYFKTGRHIIFPPVDKSISGRAAVPNHSQLLVSLLQYMGIEDINQVGDPDIGPPGPLPQLK
jgi:hypothetical protein